MVLLLRLTGLGLFAALLLASPRSAQAERYEPVIWIDRDGLELRLDAVDDPVPEVQIVEYRGNGWARFQHHYGPHRHWERARHFYGGHRGWRHRARHFRAKGHHGAGRAFQRSRHGRRR